MHPRSLRVAGAPLLLAVLLAACGGGGSSGGSGGQTPGPGAATRLDVVSAVATTAGGTLGVTITARDAQGAVATGYRGTVHLTSSDGNALLPADATFTAGDAGVHQVSATLRTAGTRSITATDTVTATITGTQAGIVVTPAAAASLTVSGFPSSTTAGVAGSVTVTALDAFGNVATGYGGIVHFTSSDGAASLPGNRAFLAGDAGVVTLPATLRTAGTRSITATDTVTATITGTQAGIVVTPAAAASLTVSGFPSSTTAGVAGSVTVTAFDAFGNVATGYRGIVHFTSSDGAASLPGNRAFLAGDAGVVTLPATLRTAGTRSLTATDTVTATITGTQAGIVVTPAAASTLTVSGFPSPTTAGVAGSVTVTALDAFGNVATGYGGIVHFTSSDGAASLPGNRAFLAGDAGVVTLPATLRTAGTRSLTATDTVTATVTGTESGIVVTPASAATLVVAGFPSQTLSGVAGSVTVTALDAFGNVATGYGGVVHFTSSDGAASLPGNRAFLFGDAGVVTLPATLRTGGTQSLTATDTVTAALTGTQAGITVVPLMFGATATPITGGTRAGQVFIAGGNTQADGAGTTLQLSWFFDPATGVLAPGPALASPRAFHTATALGGGQILVAGGASSGAGFTTFELCSLGPASSCVSTGGSLATSRCGAAAALVSAGPALVLLAGGNGCTGGPSLTSWVIWDAGGPTAPVSSGAGNALTTGRSFLTATALGGGRVLLAGGAAGGSADRFTLGATPAASTVAATGAMLAARSGHSATPLNAGTTTACPGAGPCVLVAGGLLGATTGLSWEVYDAASNTFPVHASAGHDLVVPLRFAHAAAAFSNGKVLLAGGTTDGTTPLSSTEVFDPAAASPGFTPGLSLLAPRLEAAAAYAPAVDLLNLVGGSTVAPAAEQLPSP